MTRVISLSLNLLLVFTSLPAWAEGQQAAEEALAKGQNAYFNAIFSGQARTPEQREELRKKHIDPAVSTLSRMVITQPKEMLIAPAPGDLRPGIKARKAHPYTKESPAPGSAPATPEPEVVVEGTEQKYMIEFPKPVKGKIRPEPTPAQAAVQAPAELDRKAQGVDVLELPGPSKAVSKPRAVTPKR